MVMLCDGVLYAALAFGRAVLFFLLFFVLRSASAKTKNTRTASTLLPQAKQRMEEASAQAQLFDARPI
jgi:hypothetical protein